MTGRKKNNTKKDDFTKLAEYTRELEKKNVKLSVDNEELIKLLSSKRYKAMNFLTDSTYRILRRVNKREQLINAAKKTLRNKRKDGIAKKTVRGKIDIISMNFYDWDGEVVYKGGAERYIYDLACLLKRMGYKARILQCSNIYFEKNYDGVEIIGIGAGDKRSMRTCSSVYSYYCRDAELVIASPLELASEIKDVPVIGINHGINFDSEWNRYDKDSPRFYFEHMDALKNVVSCVCVDTNFINFTRTQDYALSLKEKYIPNYYDEKTFAKVNRKNTSDKITFVYPRRIYNARGFDITVEAFTKILSKYKNRVILNFVGQVDNDEAGKLLKQIMNSFPKNVFHYEYTMDEMVNAYRDADVVLIPTKYSEGTSLSCIEGMASGAAIITTDVGGLPNLVIDDYNGLLISPTARDLEKAVVEMIENPVKMKKLAKNGLAIAKEAFTKEKWNSRWEDEIRSVLSAIDTPRS